MFLAVVRRLACLAERGRAHRHEGAPVVHVGEGLGHLDGDVLAVDLDTAPLRAGVVVLLGVGAFVLARTEEVGLGVLGTRTGREVLGVHRTADAERDLFSGDRLAGLPRGVVTDRERPLREVLVGRAQVGREVRDQDHVAGLGVAHVLGQRAARERLLDRVAGHRPATRGVQVGGTGVARQQHRDLAAGFGALDLGCGALGVLVLGDVGRRGERVVCPGAFLFTARPATCGEGEQRGTGDQRQRLVPSHCPAFLICVRALEKSVGNVGGEGQAQRLVFGSRASRMASPRRLRASTSATMPIRGSQRYKG